MLDSDIITSIFENITETIKKQALLNQIISLAARRDAAYEQINNPLYRCEYDLAAAQIERLKKEL